jgi:hypothetical protein
MSFREVTLPDGRTRTIDTGVQEIVHSSGVTQRRSVVGLLADKDQRHPGGNPRLDYARGMQWAFAGEDAVYTYPDDEGVGKFFDAALNPVDDIKASRAFGAAHVAEMKAKRRQVDLRAQAEKKVQAMMQAEKQAVEAELAALESAPENAPESEWVTPDVGTVTDKTVEDIASDGERAWKVRQ